MSSSSARTPPSPIVFHITNGYTRSLTHHLTTYFVDRDSTGGLERSTISFCPVMTNVSKKPKLQASLPLSSPSSVFHFGEGWEYASVGGENLRADLRAPFLSLVLRGERFLERLLITVEDIVRARVQKGGWRAYSRSSGDYAAGCCKGRARLQ